LRDQDHHEGYGGWRIPQIEAIITNRIAVHNPDVILLLIGINGIDAGSPAELNSLVNTIVTHAPDVHLIVAQITPKNTYIQDLYNYNTYIRTTLVPTNAAGGANISTVDMYSLFLTNSADPTSINTNLLSNGINHPTFAAYDAMAETWFQGLTNLNLLGAPDYGAVKMWSAGSSNILKLAWNTRGDKFYALQSCTNLPSGAWSIYNGCSNLVALPPGTNMSLVLPADGGRYFRVVTTPRP
jgi:hypothetical protein